MAEQRAPLPGQPGCKANAGTGEYPVGRSGFNGEFCDPLTGHYLLGNGYRAFNPVLMRFNSPDDLSPFGRGGTNAYAYCHADPVNRVDVDGHFAGFMSGIKGLTPLLMGAAVAMSVAGAGLTVAAVAVKDKKIRNILGFAGLGLGAAGLFTGAISLIPTAHSRLSGMLSRTNTSVAAQPAGVAVNHPANMVAQPAFARPVASTATQSASRVTQTVPDAPPPYEFPPSYDQRAMPSPSASSNPIVRLVSNIRKRVGLV